MYNSLFNITEIHFIYTLLFNKSFCLFFPPQYWDNICHRNLSFEEIELTILHITGSINNRFPVEI